MLRARLFNPGADPLESTSLIGAIFNASLQIGSSVGLAIVNAITTKVGSGDVDNFKGYRAGWWFIAGLAGFEAVLSAISLWHHRTPPKGLDDEKIGRDSAPDR